LPDKAVSVNPSCDYFTIGWFCNEEK
jgi:hypothetical protein